MRRTILGLALVLLTLLPALAQQIERGKMVCPEGELTTVHTFLAQQIQSGLSAEDASYLRFFTSFALPEKLQKDCEHSLAFVLNSVASYNSFGNLTVPKRVPGSATLSYIDIRDFGWSIKDVDAVFNIQPYFLNPAVTQPGNYLFRADWFITNAMDLTCQDDRGLKIFPHYILLYGLGNEPKNLTDFQRSWFVDIKNIRAQYAEKGAIVDAGDSGVSNHTRQLRRGRTIFGYYWETRDVKSHDIDPDKLSSRDYIEDIFANQVDAGEYIASHKNGLQVYFLSAGVKDKFKEVKFGDPTVVVDRADKRDPRVRTAKSCIVCHAVGINPATSALQEFFRTGGDLRTYDKKLSLIIQAFYSKSINSYIEEDNKIYERAIKECNGLTPIDNMKAFLNIYEFYQAKLGLSQAAVECGLGSAQLKGFLSKATTGRLNFLHQGRTIPRDSWDSIYSGGYIQASLLAKGLSTKISSAPPVVIVKPKARIIVDNAPILDENGRHVVYLGRGLLEVITDWDENFYYIEAGRVKGYVLKRYVSITR